MATRRKFVLAFLIATSCILIAAVLLAPIFLNVDHYRPQIISYFEQTTGKKVEIERLAFTLFPKPTIHITGFAVKSPPLFPPSYIVKSSQR